MENDAHTRYKKFQVRYSLPHLAELKSAFKLELEGQGEIFEQIRNEMSERLFSLTERVIEPLVVGVDSMASVYEQNMLTEHERKSLFELYKKIQVLKWENTMLLLSPKEKDNAKWIRKTWDLWNTDIESEVTGLCKKMSKNWGTFRFREDKPVYHE